MKKSIYIILFLILYLIVAFSSFFHAIEFFSLANQSWMAIILALAFEIGQAAVLFSILTDPHQRKKFIPWLLMGILTLIQIIGNVFSSYKYILGNSSDNLRFFKEPIFIWTDLPDDQTTVIITYITSAILPICALLLTSMVASFIHKDDELVEYIDEEDEHFEEDEPSEEALTKFEEIKKEREEKSNPIPEREEEKIEEQPKVTEVEETSIEEVAEEENDESIENLPEEELTPIRPIGVLEPIDFGKISEEEILKNVPKNEKEEIIGTGMNDNGSLIEETGEPGIIEEEPIVEEVEETPIIEEEPMVENPVPAPRMKDSHFLNLKGN